jgi:hypothetical protein
VQQPEGPPPDFSAPVLERARDVRARQINGGPVSLPLSDLLHLLRLVSFCDEEFEAAFLIDGADTSELEQRFAKVQWISLRREGPVLNVGIERAGEVLRAFGPEVLPVLASVQSAADLELITAGPESPAGIQRYAGPVEGGNWLVSSAFPNTDAQTLSAALDLSRMASAATPIEARDDAEAERVLQAANRHVIFSDPKLKRDGLRFLLEDWQREWLVLFLFRQRFRHIWDVETREREEALDQQEWDTAMERVAQQFAAPGTGESIYEGSFSAFTRGDVNALDSRIQSTAAQTDDDFAALGFTALGDVICAKLGDIIVRAYAGPDGHTYGVQYLNKWAQMGREFFTPLAGGGSLTTTTNVGQTSSMKRRVFFKTSNYTALADIHADHRAGLAILAQHGLQPAPVDADLVAFAAGLDAFLANQQEELM